MSDTTTTALVTGVIGLALVLVLRWVLRRSLAAYLVRIEARRDPADVASVRTRLTILLRVTVAVAMVIVIWQVLAVFPATTRLGNALLASSAVLAVLVGVAFTTPLSNLGAGILLALTQPIRIGDRITLGEITGTVEVITLMHTIVVTDDELSVFIPNSKLSSTAVVNRTIRDPRRWVRVSVPVVLAADVGEARRVVGEAVQAWDAIAGVDLDISVADVTDSVAWLGIVAYVPSDTRPGPVASELRERALGALAGAGLLPGD